MIGFIYEIVNCINNKKYIGQTIKNYVKYRWNNHRNELNRNVHHNDYLQNAWNYYGKDNFKFNILEQVEEENEEDLLNKLNQLEPYYIQLYKTMYYQWGYNLKLGGDNKSMSEYSKQKISKKNKGKIRTEEAKEKNRQAHLGKKASEETKQKLSEMRKLDKHWQYGKNMKEESKEKMRQKLMGDNYKLFNDEEKKDIINRIFYLNETVSSIARNYNVTYKQIRNIKDKYIKEGKL